MKFKVTLNDPDSFYDSISDAVDISLNGTTFSDDEEFEKVAELRRDKVNTALRKWVECGEYITIEFDTTAGTATVVPLK